MIKMMEYIFSDLQKHDKSIRDIQREIRKLKCVNKSVTLTMFTVCVTCMFAIELNTKLTEVKLRNMQKEIDDLKHREE